MWILGVDTTHGNTSVALTRDGEVVAEHNEEGSLSQAEALVLRI
jgi:tRNA A37 threonylcarbamoyladenosine modification protein TsaB